jgi:hypothetical protein
MPARRETSAIVPWHLCGSPDNSWRRREQSAFLRSSLALLLIGVTASEGCSSFIRRSFTDVTMFLTLLVVAVTLRVLKFA